MPLRLWGCLPFTDTPKVVTPSSYRVSVRRVTTSLYLIRHKHADGGFNIVRNLGRLSIMLDKRKTDKALSGRENGHTGMANIRLLEGVLGV
jgi:hypothetical protein